MKSKNLLNSFKYAIEGIKSAFKSERNMKVHFLMILFVCLLGMFLKLSQIEWFICTILFSIVIAGELFNTAIEIVVDMICKEKNEQAKLAKDISAGAVLILATASSIIGLWIFIPKIIDLFIK